MSDRNQQPTEPNENRIWLCAAEASALLGLREGTAVTLSLDLGRTTREVRRESGELICGDVVLPLEGLERVVKRDEKVFQLRDGEYKVVDIFAQRYAVLRPSKSAPALELDGIQMHLRHTAEPWASTRKMAAAVKPSGKEILDTCGGLGYVAIQLVQLGARSVVSVEVCPEVLRLRRENPWSADLDHPAIETRIGDIRKLVCELPAESFSGIVHDPPRMGRKTGDLYGRPFYHELYRVMAPGGLLLHYLGSPGSKRGVAGTSRVPRRLQEVGFGDLKHMREIFCCVMRKPQL